MDVNSMDGIKVVILCGGQGTRLREETEFKPKPMVTVGSMPILWHIMKIYAHYGVKDFVLCLGYRGDVIKQYFLNRGFLSGDVTVNLKDGKMPLENSHGPIAEDWSVTLAETGLNSLTGARIKRIEKYINEDEFMITYGDGIADINISRLLEYHRSKRKMGTLTGVNMPSRFGMVKAMEDGTVTEFVEKPLFNNEHVNGGFYVFKKDFFDFLSDDEGCVLETRPLTSLVEKKQLSMYRHGGFWQCMDTYRDYLELNKIWDSGKIPWKVW